MNRQPTVSAPVAEGKSARSLGAGWIVFAMLLFTLAYGGIFALKIQQERGALMTEAERSQANAAGYLAERVSARLGEVRYALSFAGTDLATASMQALSPLAETRLDTLVQSPLIDSGIIMLPDGRTFMSRPGDSALRSSAGDALSVESGLIATSARAAMPVLCWLFRYRWKMEPWARSRSGCRPSLPCPTGAATGSSLWPMPMAACWRCSR